MDAFHLMIQIKCRSIFVTLNDKKDRMIVCLMSLNEKSSLRINFEL